MRPNGNPIATFFAMPRRVLVLRLGASAAIASIALLLPSRKLLFSPGHPIPVSSYSDSSDGGASVARVGVDSLIRFAYELKGPKPFPYAALVLPMEGWIGLDLTRYAELEIEARSSRALGISAQFLVKVPPGKRFNPRDERRLLQSDLPLSKEWRRYVLPLAAFTVPAWWKAQYGVEGVPAEIPGGQAIDLEFAGSNFIFLPKDSPDTLEIRGISLRAKTGMRVFWSLLALLAIWLPWQKFVPRRYESGPQYEPRQVEEPEEAEWKQLQAWLASHYSEEPINVKVLSKATGVPSPRINPLLEKFSGIALIPYVNSIRVAEGSRLLRESSLPVKQIAFEVGFETVAHFNRVFKESQGVSPTAYRQAQ